MHERCVFHLLAERVRLPDTRKSAEARASSRERPRRQRDLEMVHGGDHLLGIASSALQASGEFGEIALVVPLRGGIELGGDGGDVGGGHTTVLEAGDFARARDERGGAATSEPERYSEA